MPLPLHETALAHAVIDGFANAQLRTPEDALRIFLTHTRRDFLKALPMRTKKERALAVRAYRDDQEALRRWLGWMADGSSRAQLLREVAENLPQADLAIQIYRRDGRDTVGIVPQPCGIRGLMTWACYQIIDCDAVAGVRRCMLDEWRRERKGRTFVTPGCQNFIFNDGATKPRIFCDDKRCGNLYRVQVARGRNDRRPQE
ncbi:MAG: hypothetical protein IT523_08275 [Burkholderiales bacterium]|nr:hypothetical protein [Burkholderiales bacterium]